jgi:2-haloacid dehalogenase
MTIVCAFDLTGTLLDLSALESFFTRTFGDARERERWFRDVLQSALALTAMGEYRPFAELGEGALQRRAERRGVRLGRSAPDDLQKAMRELPPHADAPPAIEWLASRGVRLAVLTNTSADRAREALERCGLAKRFEQIISVDEAHRLKPAREAYLLVAEKMGVRPEDIWLVAAHAWDAAGARQAGLKSALVARKSGTVDPALPAPHVIGSSLIDVVQKLTR